MDQKYIRGDKDFNKALREIKKRFHGKAGDSESESMIDCNKGILKMVLSGSMPIIKTRPN